jgi:hypothetical protein
VVRGPPPLLPALFALGAGSPSKIIPCISRSRAAEPRATPRTRRRRPRVRFRAWRLLPRLVVLWRRRSPHRTDCCRSIPRKGRCQGPICVCINQALLPVLVVLRPDRALMPYRRRITIWRQSGGGLCSFPGHVIVGQVVTADPQKRLSPLEMGCTGNHCRVPRRQQGGQNEGPPSRWTTGADSSPTSSPGQSLPS